MMISQEHCDREHARTAAPSGDILNYPNNYTEKSPNVTSQNFGAFDLHATNRHCRNSLATFAVKPQLYATCYHTQQISGMYNRLHSRHQVEMSLLRYIICIFSMEYPAHMVSHQWCPTYRVYQLYDKLTLYCELSSGC